MKDKFIVPKSKAKEFDLLVQRANRRAKKSILAIEKENALRELEGIKPLSTTVSKALLHDYSIKEERVSAYTTFSRGKVFDSERDYKQYIRHLKEWGKKKGYERDYSRLKKQYQQSIISSLTQVAINSGLPILTVSGRLPGELTKTIKSMTLEQLTHYFREADPAEDLEYKAYNAGDYTAMGSRDDFVQITMDRFNAIKKIYPGSSAGESAFIKPKKAKKAAKKRRKKK